MIQQMRRVNLFPKNAVQACLAPPGPSRLQASFAPPPTMGNAGPPRPLAPAAAPLATHLQSPPQAAFGDRVKHTTKRSTAPERPSTSAVPMLRGMAVQARMAPATPSTRSIPAAPRFAPPPIFAPRPSSPVPAPVIQRQLYRGKTPLNPAEVKVIRNSSGYQKLRDFKKQIVDHWIDDSTVKKQFTSQKKLWDEAGVAAKNPTPDLVALMPQSQLLTFADETKKPSKALLKSIQDRAEELGKQRAVEFKSTTLHFPELPVGASTTVDTEIGSRTGREHGAFFHGNNTLPNPASATTSLPNIGLTQEMISTGNYELLGRRSKAVCPTCGNVDSLVYFEVDHQDPFSNIRDQLHSLALAMSFDKTLLSRIQSQLGTRFSDYFVVSLNTVTGQQLFPTKTGLQHFSNDMQNLMSICRFCNGAFNKSDQPFVDWFQNNPLYGKPFLDSLKLNQNALIARTGSGQGIGKAARQWFDNYHWPILRQSLDLQRIIEPLQKSFYEQTTASLNSNFETDPLKKAQHQQRSQRLSSQNQAALSGVKAVSEYYTLTSIYDFAPNSPQRYEDEVREVGVKRQKRKRSDSVKFTEGVKASLDSQPKATVFSNTEEQLAYGEGYDQGAQQAKTDYALGYAHGTQNTLSTHSSKHYHRGVNDGTNRLQQVQQQAQQDALKGSKSPFAVSGSEPEAMHLRNAYLEEFTTRLLQLHGEQQKKLEEQGRELERLRQQTRHQQPTYQRPIYPQQTFPTSSSNYPFHQPTTPWPPTQRFLPPQPTSPLQPPSAFGLQPVSWPQQNQTQPPFPQQNTSPQPFNLFSNWQQ